MVRYLKFEAPWCGMCKAQDSILKSSGLEVQHIDVSDSDNDEYVEQFNIKNLPVMILVNEGDVELTRFTGITKLNDLKEAYDRFK